MNDLATTLQGDLQKAALPYMDRIRTALDGPAGPESKVVLLAIAEAAEGLAELLRQWRGLGSLVPPEGMAGDQYAEELRAAFQGFAEWATGLEDSPAGNRCRQAMLEFVELSEPEEER